MQLPQKLPTFFKPLETDDYVSNRSWQDGPLL